MAVNRNTPAGRVFDAVNIVVLLALAVVTILPFIYVTAGSFAKESELAERSFFLWPRDFVTDTYDYIFSTNTFLRSLIVTIAVTGVAGPGGGTDAKPVGLTYVAIAGPSGGEVQRHLWDGDRATNKRCSAEAALLMLLSALERLAADPVGEVDQGPRS